MYDNDKDPEYVPDDNGNIVMDQIGDDIEISDHEEEVITKIILFKIVYIYVIIFP